MVTMIACNKDSSDVLVIDELMIELEETLEEPVAPCILHKGGELSFDYFGKEYKFNDPDIEMFLDTSVVDSIVIPYKLIGIQLPLDNKRTFNLVIKDVETPFDDCIPLRGYTDIDSINYCLGYDIPSVTILVQCSYTFASLRTEEIDHSSSKPISKHSVEITDCVDGKISGYFENNWFKKGTFCNVKIY